MVDEQLSYNRRKTRATETKGESKGARESEGTNRKAKVREKDGGSEMERGLCHSAPESEGGTEEEKGRSSHCF